MIGQRLKECLLERSEIYRCRFIYQAADAVLSAPTKGRETTNRSGSLAYRRAQSVTDTADRYAPWITAWIRERLIDPSYLPACEEAPRIIGFGSGATVFRLGKLTGDDGPDWVLKIFRRSLGRSGTELRRQLIYRQATYHTVCRWYEGLDIVPEAHFLLLHGPVLALPAVGCLQPAVSSERFDLVHDLDDSRLLSLASSNQLLRASIIAFFARTLDAATEEDACIDVVGKDNVVLAPHGDSYRLIILDHGIYRFGVKAFRDPEALARTHRRLEELERRATLLKNANSNYAIQRRPPSVGTASLTSTAS
jgi:hypothetical protein